MAEPTGPDKSDDDGRSPEQVIRDKDLERRRRELDVLLAAKRDDEAQRNLPRADTSGYGQALKISSEFIAGVVVGGGLGWFIDRLAGTSPWGLIVFLLLGFCAGVLNVLRSAGMVAEKGRKNGSGTGSVE